MRGRRHRAPVFVLPTVAVALSCGLAGCGTQSGLASAGSAVATTQGSSNPIATASVAPAGLPCPASSAGAAATPDGLPALTLDCLGPGPAVNLAGVAGPAVVNVWASWCVPCRAEAPMLAALARDTDGRLTVLGINVLDDRAAATEAAAAIPLASVYDPSGSTRAPLGWTGPPVTYLVDSSGRIVHRIYGQIPDDASLRSAVRQYLNVESGHA